MSLLTIIQDAADDIGVLQPSSVINNTNEEVKKLLRLANKVGNRLMKCFPWQVLTKETTFTSVATEEQTSILAADFDRFIPETMWNRTDIFLISGPVSATEWQGLKSVSFSDEENRKFRYRGGAVLIIPTMTAGKTIAFEYVSNQWCTDSGGTGQTAWAADTDLGVIDEELITRGVIWEFLNSEGLPSASAAASYEEYFEILIENDRPHSGVVTSGDIFGGMTGTRHFSGAPQVSSRGGLF